MNGANQRSVTGPPPGRDASRLLRKPMRRNQSLGSHSSQRRRSDESTYPLFPPGQSMLGKLPRSTAIHHSGGTPCLSRPYQPPQPRGKQ